MSHPRRMRLLPLALLLAVACDRGPSLQVVIESHRAQVEQKLSKLRGLATRLDEAVEPPPERRPAGAIVFDTDDARYNALKLQAEDLADLSSPQEKAIRLWFDAPWLEASALLTRGTFASGDRPEGSDEVRHVDELLRSFRSLAYVLVFRTERHVSADHAPAAPVVPGPAPLPGSTDFLSGDVEGSVLLFDLESAELLLRFEVAAEHDDEIRYDVRDPAGALRSNLAKNARREIRTGLLESLPSTVWP